MLAQRTRARKKRKKKRKEKRKKGKKLRPRSMARARAFVSKKKRGKKKGTCWTSPKKQRYLERSRFYFQLKGWLVGWRGFANEWRSFDSRSIVHTEGESGEAFEAKIKAENVSFLFSFSLGFLPFFLSFLSFSLGARTKVVDRSPLLSPESKKRAETLAGRSLSGHKGL